MGSEDRQAIYGSLVIYDITKHRTGPKHGYFCDLFMQISNILQHPAGTMVVPKYIKHRLHCALENFLLQVYTGCIYLLEQNRNRDFSSNIESKSIIWLKSHIVTALYTADIHHIMVETGGKRERKEITKENTVQ